jgi:VIT1/CCC1 family predicted Fe2+/Mn2+ transporter
MNELKNWQEERQSAYLYRVLAEVEAGTTRAGLFRELAGESDKQALIWEKQMREHGEEPPREYRPDLRTRIVALLLRRCGPRRLRSVLSAMKVRGMSLYARPETGMHTMPLNIAEVGRRHRGSGSVNNLRAAVFGVNDGLVSNASLIMGVAGAAADGKTILLTGIAGLAAGAFSMAAGEYISVRSQREMYEYQISLERAELETYPLAEAAELALIYEAKGIAKEEAKRVAAALIADPAKALDTLAREELGINPEDLVSPWGAAISSFFSFSAGALVPVAPFLLGQGSQMLILAIALTAAALYAVGATLSLYTGRSALMGGLRMLLIGSTAGALTYGIGKLVGASV